MISITKLEAEMILALVDTARRTTDLQNVYNDQRGTAYSWHDVRKLVLKLKEITDEHI